MQCPSCHVPVADGQLECPSCGIVVSKWRDRAQRPRTQTTTLVPGVRPFNVIVATVVLLTIVVIAGLWLSRRWTSTDDPDPVAQTKPPRDGSLRAIEPSGPDFDLAYQLPARPQGGATNGRQLVLASGTDPWGALRVEADGEGLKAKGVPIIESRYNQKMSVHTLTWNGRNYVGYTTGSWFQKKGDVFTIHDPSTLQVLETRPAPPLLGGLAWDGTRYWASTRKNTPDAKEEAFFYKLDSGLNVIAKTKPPGIGCQGLAWDGRHLWYVDVFSDTIDVLDVSGPEPRIVHSKATEIDYLSGIVSWRKAIWVTDYGKNRLQRLRHTTRMAWAGGGPATAVAATMQPAAESQALTGQYRNRFAARKPDDAETIEWAAELRPDGVWLTGARIWFGPELFAKREQPSSVITLPLFARYTFTVEHPDGTETEKQFDALAGDNVLPATKLAGVSGPGEVSVTLFIHVQFIDSAGTARILNNSGGFVELRR